MVLKKNSFTFVASGCPVVQEIFEKNLTFIPAVQTNHHIDEIGQQQSKKQAYLLMRVGGITRNYLEGVVAGTIIYAKGVSEEVPKAYVSNISTKLFVCEEIGVGEPVVNDEVMEKKCNFVQEYLDEEDSAAEVQEA
jgi:hypothetical protein